MSEIRKAIRLMPVFVGQTDDGEKIVLYKNIRDAGKEDELHLKRPDGELWALSPGSTVVMDFDLTAAKLTLSVRSPEWTGSARGTHKELKEEEAIR